MPEYIVHINELCVHTLILEAASKEAAIETGYQLLTNGMSDEEKLACSYDFDSEGFTGQHEVREN